MVKQLPLQSRLIVAADYENDPNEEPVREKILRLCDSLAGSGVIIKVNSALRMYGYGLIDEIHERDLEVFADLKYYDIAATLDADASFLRMFKPSLVTVACDAGFPGLKRLRDELPDTEVLGVTVLTSLNDSDMERVGRVCVADAVRR